MELKVSGTLQWYFPPETLTGVASSLRGAQGERRIGALTAIKARAPVLGGNFGVWGGLFSTFDCTVKGIRKKEDPWNASTSRRTYISRLQIGHKAHV